EVVLLALARAVVAQVDELVRLRGERADVADLDRLHVGRARAGGEARGEVGVVVGEGGLALLDLDVRVGLLELLVQRPEAEVAEQPDGQLDLLSGGRRVLPAGAGSAAAGGDHEHRGRDEGDQEPGTRSTHRERSLGAVAILIMKGALSDKVWWNFHGGQGWAR